MNITDPKLLARLDAVINNGVIHRIKTKDSLGTLNDDIKAVAKDSGISPKAIRRMVRIACSENPNEEGEDTDIAYEILRKLKRVE